MDPRQATLESRTQALRTRARTPVSKRPGGSEEPLFPVALRGYDRQAVEEYVERMSRYVADLGDMGSRQAAVRDALEDLGSETSGILQHAHETADGITSRASEQARERLAEAESEASRRLAEADSHARRVASDTERVWSERTRLLEDMRELAESLLRVADDAAERLPELPALNESSPGGEAPAALTPPPPPPPGEETKLPPPPPPADAVQHLDDYELEYDDEEMWEDGSGDGEHEEPPSPSGLPDQRFAATGADDSERFVPPPDRDQPPQVDRPTEAMDPVDLPDGHRGGTFRAFKGPDMSWRSRH